MEGAWKRGENKGVIKKKKRKAKKLFPQAFPTPSYLKRKIAILPLEEGVSSPLFSPKEATQVLTDRIRKKVLSVKVVDYPTVQSVMEKLKIGDLKEKRNLQRLGAALGVQAIMVGKIYGPFIFYLEEEGVEEEGERRPLCSVEIRLKLIDTLRGEELEEFKLTKSLLKAAGEDIYEEVVASAVDEEIDRLRKIFSRMPWYTRVALVEGNATYLLAGSESGLKEGDILEVYSPSDFHTPKGKVRVGRLFGLDGAIAYRVKGGGFRTADVVRFVEEAPPGSPSP